MNMLDFKKFPVAYLTGAVIVWVAIIIATAVTLSGTPYLTQMLIILSGGTFWFIVIVPGAFFRGRQKSKPPFPT